MNAPDIAALDIAHFQPSPTDGPRRHWEDFQPGMTLQFGPREFQAADIIEFATDFDPQPFHLSEEGGKASLFGGLAASGWHTAGVMMRLMCDGFILNSSSLGSPGLENLRWLKPVLAGDRLYGRVTVLATRPMNSRPDVGLVQSRWDGFNQRGEPVITIQSWAMFGRRPT